MLGSLKYTRAQHEDMIAETAAYFAETERLPNLAYTSDAFLELERLTVFARDWMFAGRASQIPETGDILPVTVAGHDLILIRQRDGSVGVFHNVCPHRGARLVEEPRRGEAMLTCAYHAWSFGLDGAPRMRPHFYRGGQHETNPSAKGMCGLAAVRSHQWIDFIYVNIGGDADPFETWMKPVLDALEPYDFRDITYVRTIDYDLACNWKLAMENFWDTYHIFSAHPAVEKQMPMEDRDNAVTRGKIIIGGYDYPAKPDDNYVGRKFGMPTHGGDQDYIRNRSWFICCYPSNMLQVWEDALVMVEMRPVSADRTTEHFHFYLVGDGATADEFADQRDAVIGFMDNFQREDMDIVRWMQSGRGSVAYGGGDLSAFWDPQVVAFSRLVTESIQKS